MKRIVFLIFMFTILLVAGKRMHVNLCKITTNSVSKRNSFFEDQEKLSNLNQIFLLSKSTDFDCEEEFSSNNDSKSDKVFQVKPSYHNKWYLFYEVLLDSFYFKNIFYNSKSFTILNTPIYITQNVLRI